MSSELPTKRTGSPRSPYTVGRSTTAITVGIVLIIGCFFASARADDEAFTVYKLSVAGELLQHWVEDLDGDQFQDILVIHRKGLEPDETRWISVFWQDAGKGFGTAADQSWEIDLDAAALDIGDVAGDERKEICFLTNTGIRYYPIGENSYQIEPLHLLDAPSLVAYPSERSIPMINFVRDWNGDGRDEVGVATFEGLSVYSQSEDGDYTLEYKVSIEPNTRIYHADMRNDREKTAGIRAHYGFPSVQLLDHNNDDLEDLVATTEDRVIVHLNLGDGSYAEQASVDRLFDVRTQQEKIEGWAEIQTRVADLNKDGYADAVVSKQTAKGMTNFRGVVNVFWGRAEGFGEEPDQLIISEGTASVGALFLDVNGDGREDLVLPSIKVSIAAIIRILMTRSIKVYFNIFLLHEDDRFSERPDYSKEVKFKIDFSGESDDQAMDLEGDYNGDKRTDFVFATEKAELSIYLGEEAGKDRLFSKKPATTITADAYGELSSHDLNKDGYSDMIIHYRENKDLKGTLEVLVNNANW